jgi:peptide/nickel transport system permease protein
VKAACFVRGFLWLAALTPFLANALPLWHADRDGSSSPVVRALDGEDLFWLAVVAFDAAWLLVRRARERSRPERPTARALAPAAVPTLVWLALAVVALSRDPPPSTLHLRSRALAPDETVVWTPGGFGPVDSDWELVDAPGSTLPAPPSARHWLGTDPTGRDLLARLLYGTRVSLGVATAATAIALTLGLLVGLLCGTLRGWVDLLLMRVVEVMLCFPQLFLVLVVFAYLPPSRSTLVWLFGLVGWTTTARLARDELLRLQSKEFVLAARALHVPPWRLALRHLLPNALAPVLVAATFSISNAMVAEFGLSWLHFGVRPPEPSLGQVLADGEALLQRGSPWIALAPGLLIFAVVTSWNALGESLREATTPERAAAARASAERAAS